MLLAAYARGLFPMAGSRDDPEIRWFSPEMRGVLPLSPPRIPRSLLKSLRKNAFEIRFDTAFPDVIHGCAARGETWINDAIIALYTELWRRGFAHSAECFHEGRLVGGLYGIALGGAFFGESMFSRESGASKAALAALMTRLAGAGYTLLDTQYVNDHLLQFGAEEIPRAEYLHRLRAALALRPEFCF